MDNSKKNILYQMLYQVVILVIPLIISPYLANKLGAEAIGIYSYAYSIAYIFFIIARLGIVEFGTREIAACKDDNEETRKTLWTILFSHGLFGLASALLYIFYVLFACKANKGVFLSQLLFVISPIIDLTWVYFGLNRFKDLIRRNIFVKILELVLIIIFVKTKSDLILYSIIMSGSYLLGNVVVIPRIIQKFRIYIPTKEELFSVMKPLLVLSVSIVALNIYQIIDKVLLGALTNTVNVGFYEYSEKLVKVPVHIINSISTVMLPTMTYLAKNAEYETMRDKFNSSSTLLSFLAFAFAFGMASVSNFFIPLYYNEQFIKCSLYLSLLTPLIFLLTFNNTLRAQFLLPLHKDKEYVLSLVISFLTNIVLSIVLIPLLEVNGAIIGTVLGEAISMVFELLIVRKYISIIDYIRNTVPFIVIGLVMYSITNFVKATLATTWTNLLILTVIGGLVYLILSIVYLCLFQKNIFNEVMAIIVKNLGGRRNV